MSLAQDNEYLTNENMKLAGKLHEAEVKLKFYRNFIECATELLETYGWVMFGTHAVESPTPQLIFSEQKDLDGLPLFERLSDE
jgi:hypothetical protein